MTTDDRSAKRLRLSDHLHSLLPDGTSPSTTTVQQPTFQPSLHMNSDSTAAFSQQYHWPAEPSTASNIDQTSGGIPGLGGMSLPSLSGNSGGIGVNSPGLTGVRFTDDTLNSASTGGDANVNVIDPSITGNDLGKPTSTAQILAARTSNGNTGYADLMQPDSALSPNLSNAGIPTGNGSNTAGSKKRSATSDVDDIDDSENPSPKPTPFSRTPELKVHHKLAERQRRKEMKDLFDELRELLPTERGTKSSKWEILKKAIGYIEQMKQRESDSVAETERLKREVEMLSGGPAGGYGINMNGGGVSDLTVGAALSGLGVDHQEQDQTPTGGNIGVGMGGNGQVEMGKGEQ